MRAGLRAREQSVGGDGLVVAGCNSEARASGHDPLTERVRCLLVALHQGFTPPRFSVEELVKDLWSEVDRLRKQVTELQAQSTAAVERIRMLRDAVEDAVALLDDVYVDQHASGQSDAEHEDWRRRQRMFLTKWGQEG